MACRPTIADLARSPPTLSTSTGSASDAKPDRKSSSATSQDTMLDPATRNQNTKAIITGGAQGIGFAIARQLSAEGCRSIAIAGRTAEKGARAVDQLKALGVYALFVQADVRKVEDCSRIVAAASDRFGTINGLVNAAA